MSNLHRNHVDIPPAAEFSATDSVIGALGHDQKSELELLNFNIRANPIETIQAHVDQVLSLVERQVAWTDRVMFDQLKKLVDLGRRFEKDENLEMAKIAYQWAFQNSVGGNWDQQVFNPDIAPSAIKHYAAVTSHLAEREHDKNLALEAKRMLEHKEFGLLPRLESIIKKPDFTISNLASNEAAALLHDLKTLIESQQRISRVLGDRHLALSELSFVGHANNETSEAPKRLQHLIQTTIRVLTPIAEKDYKNGFFAVMLRELQQAATMATHQTTTGHTSGLDKAKVTEFTAQTLKPIRDEFLAGQRTSASQHLVKTIEDATLGLETDPIETRDCKLALIRESLALLFTRGTEAETLRSAKLVVSALERFEPFTRLVMVTGEVKNTLSLICSETAKTLRMNRGQLLYPPHTLEFFSGKLEHFSLLIQANDILNEKNIRKHTAQALSFFNEALTQSGKYPETQKAVIQLMHDWESRSIMRDRAERILAQVQAIIRLVKEYDTIRDVFLSSRREDATNYSENEVIYFAQALYKKHLFSTNFQKFFPLQAPVLGDVPSDIPLAEKLYENAITRAAKTVNDKYIPLDVSQSAYTAFALASSATIKIETYGGSFPDFEQLEKAREHLFAALRVMQNYRNLAPESFERDEANVAQIMGSIRRNAALLYNGPLGARVDYDEPINVQQRLDYLYPEKTQDHSYDPGDDSGLASAG